jgi:hypothetical protein
MSGPIVRKYGFANFEKIFGERPLQHGIEDTENTPSESAAGASTKPSDLEKKPKSSTKSGKKKAK